MGTVIPLGDATRRPLNRSVATALIILVNALVFLLELRGGEPFVMRWSVIPADIVAGHHWINVLTGMFMHASWSHIIGNMVFLWAFGREIEDAMGQGATWRSISSAGWLPCWPSWASAPVPRFPTWARAARSLR